VPFLSRGKTLGFKRINQFYTLENILQELAKGGFIGRLVFDGVCRDLGKVLLRIELTGEKIVALEAEVGGKLYKGPQALEYYRKCLTEGEGYVEIIELDSEKVLIDLEDNPDARINLMIELPEARLKFSALHAAAKGKGLGLLGKMLYDMTTTECLTVEGIIDGKCDGVIKGELCPDSVNVVLSVKGTVSNISRKDELEGAFNAAQESCSMAELVMKRSG